MFDDFFLFAALERLPMDKRMLVLSVRSEEEFAVFKQLGWQSFVENNVMISAPFSGGNYDFEVISEGAENHEFALILGDLAAFTEQKIDYISHARPYVVKANFVTSPIDGPAFLPAIDSDKMPEAANRLVTMLKGSGYSCYASSWYRNDAPLKIWELDENPDMRNFPFNIVAFRDQKIARAFFYMSDIFRRQEALISVEHAALVARLNNEIDKRSPSLLKSDEDQKSYILMLEDAMIALQHSDKIKLKRS